MTPNAGRQERSDRTPKLLRLPTIDESKIPGWWFARHAVGATIGVFAALVITAIVAAMFVTMKMTVDADGVLEPATVWPVRSLESGIVSVVFVRPGDSVNAGTIVARLDTAAAWNNLLDVEAQAAAARIDLARLIQSTPIDIRRAEAGVAEAEAHVARAQTTLRQRMADFSITGDLDSIAKASGQRVHVGLDAAVAELLGARAALALAETQVGAGALGSYDVERKRADVRRLERTLVATRAHFARLTIAAPASGIILTDQLEQVVGAAIVAGQTFLEIGSGKGWRATVALSERDVHRVRVGDEADVQLPAFAMLARDRVRGRVTDIAWQPPSALSTGPSFAPVTGYRVAIALDSADVAQLGRSTLRRGYAVRTRISTRSGRAFGLLLDHFRASARSVR